MNKNISLDDIKLNDKQTSIFKLIVETYIETGEPVGSKKLVEKCKLNTSSATIRNIMALLETYNLLEKPHISGGRVPSTLGLQYYAKYLIYDPKNISIKNLKIYLQKGELELMQQ